MNVKSFEPSDEAMALIDERLAPVRAAADERRSRLQAKYGEGAPIQFFGEPDQPGDLATAYGRSLKHECLLRELQVLGLDVWERTGKKAQFDALTQQVIENGRLAGCLNASNPRNT
jgi:hypothetical protein